MRRLTTCVTTVNSRGSNYGGLLAENVEGEAGAAWHTSHVNSIATRLTLSPLTSLKAVRMMHKSGWSLSFDVAWRAIRVATCPDELGYREYGHSSNPVRSPQIDQTPPPP